MSNYKLTVFLGTYNRLKLLQKVIDSVVRGTKCDYELIVFDGGSTDGTVEYLKNNSHVTSIFQGQLYGIIKAYNMVWRTVDTEYSCWLSDDTELVEGGLDLALQILEHDGDIGMVGLKTKDTVGMYRNQPYNGGLSEYGVLNCNHGVLRTELARHVGYFNEDYTSYMMDPDLTASILSLGKAVVMTKTICILHHREWIVKEGLGKMKDQIGGTDIFKIYRDKFSFLSNQIYFFNRLMMGGIFKIISLFVPYRTEFSNINLRDLRNIIMGQFVKLNDFRMNKNRTYYFYQKIPENLLYNNENPYKSKLLNK
jgi:glycosyltransferase involved in cell wall biosynthesis